jgi:hypothetical protein
MASTSAPTLTRVPRAFVGAAQRAPRGVTGGQFSADLVGEEVVLFVIGMRVNRWRKLRSWLPTFVAMPRMLRELGKEPDSPLLDVRTYWSGRVFLTLQYWRSLEELGAYARDSSRLHAPAWSRFNQTAAATSDVGIFHETYRVTADSFESLYGNMPPFGLAAAQQLVPRGSRGRRETVRRMGQQDPELVDVAVGGGL